ncbi:MAG: flagellar protein FlaG [Clostridia bacterium]|nr:flagellar protein FlaG [Clostridia bacterium]
MRIEGIDPMILNHVQNQTQNYEVKSTKGIKVTTEQKYQQGQHQSKEDEIKQSVKQLNETLDIFNIKVRFKIDREDDELYIYLIDTEKSEVIRRIPPETLMEAANRMQNMVGLILDTII